MQYTEYESYASLVELYQLLQDEQSKHIFWARLQYDMEPSFNNMLELLNGSDLLSDEMRLQRKAWKKKLREICDENSEIIMYGAGEAGQLYFQLYQKYQIPIAAFCDKQKCGQTICGKPVISPEELFLRIKNSYVIISTPDYYREISEILKKNGFPDDQILHAIGPLGGISPTIFPRQYFEFSADYFRGGAFVDGGCFDGEDTVAFAKWSGGKYSKIIAFEPDPAGYQRCKRNLNAANIRDVEVINAGLSDSNGKAGFECGSHGDGRIMPHELQTDSIQIDTVALDTAIDTKIGMIKMDIEGAEFLALYGAKQTITRDMPFLAICVYHKPGDLLAIMGYLHQLVPQYRFWLRHYSGMNTETVLYASVKF